VSVKKYSSETTNIRITVITELNQKHVTESHKTLGTYKCVVGVELELSNQLLLKSNKICNLEKGGQFDKQQILASLPLLLNPVYGILSYCGEHDGKTVTINSKDSHHTLE
jgi:hypothetical protein